MNIKTIIIVLIIALGCIAIFYFFQNREMITNYPSSGEAIVAFGDSLVKGVGATKGNDFVTLLSEKIGQPIINLGVSGDTTANGLARVQEVIDLKPKVVLVLFGGNDFLRQVPMSETFENVDKIVTELQSSGAVVVLLGIRGGLLADQYAESFEKIAETRGALYVSDVLNGLITRREYMSDSVHPNDAGYNNIAEKIYPVLQKAL